MISQAMWHRESGNVRHPFLGVNGIRIVGRQPCVVVVANGGEAPTLANDLAQVDDLSGDGVGTIFNGNYVSLNPMELGGRLFQYAVMYSKYVFRKLKFTYFTTSPTSTAGSIAMCVTPIAGPTTISGPPGSMSQVRTMDNSCFTTVWNPSCSVSYAYSGMDTFYTGYSSSNDWKVDGKSFSEDVDADLWYQRTSQGFLAMFGTVNPTVSSVTYGFIDVEYEVEFYYGNTANFNLYNGTLLEGKAPRPDFKGRPPSFAAKKLPPKTDDSEKEKSAAPSAPSVPPLREVESLSPDVGDG